MGINIIILYDIIKEIIILYDIIILLVSLFIEVVQGIRLQMSKRLLFGSSDFDEIIRKDPLIVDKTLFIKEYMEDGAKVTCILRPRYVDYALKLILQTFW